MDSYLEVIQNVDIFPNSKIVKPKVYELRQTVKAIVLNTQKEVALVTNPIHNLYSLPGGGVESANLNFEIIRECLEELGCEIRIISTVGKINEFRDRDAKEYITTCFVGEVIKVFKQDFRTDEEITNGLKIVWVDKSKLKYIFHEQKAMVISGKVGYYNTAFNIIRDGIFINQWLDEDANHAINI